MSTPDRTLDEFRPALQREPGLLVHDAEPVESLADGAVKPSAAIHTPLDILLVEDTLGDAVLLKQALSEAAERFRVTRAATLAEGLALARQRPFDVILLDLSLPDSTGMATVESAHAAVGSAPLIVLTGLDCEETGLEAVRAGAQDYLIKGKTGSDLLVRSIRYAIERKRAEQALRDSEERHRTILDQMQEGVIFADASDTVRHVNACACVLLGAAWEQVVGRPVLSVHPEPVRARVAAVLRGFRDGTGSDVVTIRRPMHDRELILRFSSVRGGDGGYWGVITTIVDITDQMQMQQQLAEARQMERLGRLAGGIAHEFNNLMATALGLASHLKRKRSPQDPDYPAFTQIEQATETAGRLAHQLLAYAKGGKIRPRIMKLADVVGRAVEAFKPAVPPLVELECHVANDLGDVECDTTQVEQAIVNLCRNAAEAMPRCGRVRMQAENASLSSPLEDARPPLPAGEYVCVAVQDDGCGMTPEVVSHLFEPFFTTKPRGHGLGLASAWGIVKSHGGAISVTTESGVGSTFRIWLPRVQTTHREE
jgi:two-component system cell cycle sensor histidine kinase/response regulator CckA